MKDSKPKFVAYLRVSTDRQGKSGLGLDAQRTAVHQFVAQRGGEIIAPEYREIESGKVNNRPELEKAMKRCRLTGATLLVAKLDRLSRNAAFLMTLKDSGVPFVAADMPDANTLTIGVMASLAQHEREMISKRTKAALEAARARGTKLVAYASARQISRYIRLPAMRQSPQRQGQGRNCFEMRLNPCAELACLCRRLRPSSMPMAV
jgi:DNA invertase Pin-like site-specific DNA recombinase